MQNNIAVLLPYKDQFIKDNAGSASIWVKDFSKDSKLKKNTTIFGYTSNVSKTFDNFNYVNLKFSNFGVQSKNLKYVNKFIDVLNRKKFSLIEIHNRPSYILHIEKNLPNQKYILVIHNNPQTLRGAVTPKERKHLIKLCSKITFVSNWVKEKFFEGLDIKNHEKTQVLYPAINKIIKMPKKEKIITFVGKLNHSKGYDTFGRAIIRILKKYKDWKSIVIGDEPREKYNFKHDRLIHLGWITHDETLQIYKKSSISVVPSHWEEPFGRTSLEAASRGCATIISKKGGLPETIPYGLYLNKINQNEIYKKIKQLIVNKKGLQGIVRSPDILSAKIRAIGRYLYSNLTGPNNSHQYLLEYSEDESTLSLLETEHVLITYIRERKDVVFIEETEVDSFFLRFLERYIQDNF